MLFLYLTQWRWMILFHASCLLGKQQAWNAWRQRGCTLRVLNTGKIKGASVWLFPTPHLLLLHFIIFILLSILWKNSLFHTYFSARSCLKLKPKKGEICRLEKNNYKSNMWVSSYLPETVWSFLQASSFIINSRHDARHVPIRLQAVVWCSSLSVGEEERRRLSRNRAL